MKLHIYLDENESMNTITNFDLAREVVNLCDENDNTDIKAVISMIMAQIEFVDRENSVIKNRGDLWQ